MSTAVRRALYGRLSGDLTLTGMLGTPAANYSQAIYHDPAPETAAYPLVVFSKSSGTPTEAFGNYNQGGGRAYDTDVWLVKAVTTTSQDTSVDRSNLSAAERAEKIAERIQALLNDGTLSISGGALMYLRRQSDVEYSEVISGELFRHAGALYRLIYQ